MSTREARRRIDLSRKLAERGWFHSFELPDGSRIEGVQSLDYQKQRYAQFGLPDDLTGRTVLDIGPWDGWYSFEAERRGAEVTAIDCVEIPNFRRMHERLGSRVRYLLMDLYDLPRAGLGTFDYVFFMGVLYHVRHPLLALEIVCALTREMAAIDSLVTDGESFSSRLRRRSENADEIPTLEFYETDELGGHLDNWFGPTVRCLQALCRSAGFARAEIVAVEPHRAAVACHRRWPPPAHTTQPAPVLESVVHSRNYGRNFYSNRDEYLTAWFESPVAQLTREQVYLEIGSLGVPAMYLNGDRHPRWQLNCRFPPGVQAGWRDVRLRTAASPLSNAVPIAVDILPQAKELEITSVRDGVDWETGRVNRERGGFLSIWVRGLGDNCDVANVRVFADGQRLAVEYVGECDEADRRQVNARIPESFAAGEYTVVVSFGSVTSRPLPLRVV